MLQGRSKIMAGYKKETNGRGASSRVLVHAVSSRRRRRRPILDVHDVKQQNANRRAKVFARRQTQDLVLDFWATGPSCLLAEGWPCRRFNFFRTLVRASLSLWNNLAHSSARTTNRARVR